MVSGVVDRRWSQGCRRRLSTFAAAFHDHYHDFSPFGTFTWFFYRDHAKEPETIKPELHPEKMRNPTGPNKNANLQEPKHLFILLAEQYQARVQPTTKPPKRCQSPLAENHPQSQILNTPEPNETVRNPSAPSRPRSQVPNAANRRRPSCRSCASFSSCLEA